jgi:hypothetical protein
MLRDLGLKTFKIASSESGHAWWNPEPSERWVVSYPWGVVTPCPFECEDEGDTRFVQAEYTRSIAYRLTAIPLYPTPLEAVGRATLLEGWSDHVDNSIAACQWAIAQGVKVVEAHLCLPGRTRVRAFEKAPHEFRQLRDFAEACETMRSGVGQTFRDRWSKSA